MDDKTFSSLFRPMIQRLAKVSVEAIVGSIEAFIAENVLPLQATVDMTAMSLSLTASVLLTATDAFFCHCLTNAKTPSTMFVDVVEPSLLKLINHLAVKAGLDATYGRVRKADTPVAKTDKPTSSVFFDVAGGSDACFY
jgi:hypothetical protein